MIGSIFCVDEMHRAVGHSEVCAAAMVASRRLKVVVIEPAELSGVAAFASASPCQTGCSFRPPPSRRCSYGKGPSRCRYGPGPSRSFEFAALRRS